jgi:hypothetical protein
MERNPDLGGKLRYTDGSAQETREGTTIVSTPREGGPDAPDRPRRPFRSLRRLGAMSKRPDGRGGGVLEALEADALLLREENARLRVKLEASPDVGHVIERLRTIPPRSQDEHGEDAWQMLTEMIVMRNSLIDVCREIGQTMAGLQSSLEALELPDGYVGETNGHLRNGHRRNGHLKEAGQK